MKSLILAVVMLVASLVVSVSSAVAEIPMASSVKLAVDATFQFHVFSPRAGLVSFKDYEAAAGFPRVNGELVEGIRWYYSPVSFDDVTPDSPYVEVWMNLNNLMIPPVGIGGLRSGERYFFKVGLATRHGELVYFTNEYETQMARNSVLVQ